VLQKDTGEHVSAGTHGVLWSIAFILCLVYASLYFIFILIFGTWLVYAGGLTTLVLVGGIPPLTAFLSAVIARKWELIGGVILAAVFLLLVIWDIVTEQHLAASTYFSLPFLLSGLFFILSWWLSSRRLSKKTT